MKSLCSGKLKYFVFFVVWCTSSTLFYFYVNTGWGAAQSFYYAIQAGFSIGFGVLDETKVTGLDLFDECATSAMELSEATFWLQTGFQAKLDTFTKDKIAELPGNLSSKLYLPCVSMSQRNENSDFSLLFTIFHVALGASLIVGVLGVFTQSAIDSQSFWLDEAEPGKGPENHKCSKQWKKRWPVIKSFVVFSLWTLFGAVVFTYENEVGFLQGFYFAVTAASTAGLMGTTPTETGLVLAAIYCIVGVPLYAHTLGKVANYFTSNYLQEAAEARRQLTITKREFEAIDRMGNGNGAVERHEFSLLWLLRNGG